jgi:hypothetical protein
LLEGLDLRLARAIASVELRKGVLLLHLIKVNDLDLGFIAEELDDVGP